MNWKLKLIFFSLKRYVKFSFDILIVVQLYFWLRLEFHHYFKTISHLLRRKIASEKKSLPILKRLEIKKLKIEKNKLKKKLK